MKAGWGSHSVVITHPLLSLSLPGDRHWGHKDEQSSGSFPRSSPSRGEGEVHPKVPGNLKSVPQRMSVGL